MNILHEMNWHEGMFLNPHHLQQFQRAIFDGFKYNNKSMYCYPYGIIDSGVNEKKLRDDGILEFEKLLALMPSGYLIDIKTNSHLPPISVEGVIKPGENSAILYLCLPLRSDIGGNLVAESNNASFQGARLYSNSEQEHNDLNTGINEKVISRYKLNPRIYTSDDNIDGYESITVVCVKKNEKNDIIIDREFIPSCFKITGSPVLMHILRDIHLNLESYVERFSMELNSFLELNFQSKNLMYAIHKLRILSSYAIDLKEIYLHPIHPPFRVYMKLKKLIAELIAVTPGYYESLNYPYDHDSQGTVFKELQQVLLKLLNVNVVQKNYEEFVFGLCDGAAGSYTLEVPNDFLKKGYDYYISIRTKMSTVDLIKNVELGKNFKCLPSSMLKLQAIPGFTLRYVASLPNEFINEHNEFLFIINDANQDLLVKLFEEKKIAVIERLSKIGINIKQISLVVYHGTN
jgi:type VI secretion system protein ImpJ